MSAYNHPTFPLDLEEPLFEAFPGVLPPGERAPDGELVDLASGEKVRLRQIWKRGPVMVEFGSFS